MFRKKIVRPALLLAVLLLAVSTAAVFASRAPAAEESEAKVGYPVLSDAKLESILAGQGKGKVVILSFFASWCPPCRKEIPQLAHLRTKVQDKDMLILGVSADDSLEELSRFLLRVKANFPIYLGTPELFQKFEVSTIPKMVVFNSKGEVFQVIDGLLPEDSFNSMVDYLLGSAYE